MNKSNRTLCVAPMMDWTDRHFRYFCRLLSPQAMLYSEMVTTGAILRGNTARFLDFSKEEHPVALQLGGSDPEELAKCARLAERYGYDEVNLNVGCPSDRVQKHLIGACLMAHPNLVKECLDAMRQAVQVPVTIKHRIGVDDKESFEHLEGFIARLKPVCRVFIIHARKAILNGLSPAENRSIPPLNYAYVHEIKKLHPELEIVINGGIDTVASGLEQLQYGDGVMLGRAAYHNTWLLRELSAAIFESTGELPENRHDAVQRFLPYVAQALSQGTPLQHVSRHLLGIFHAQAGGKRFRRFLSENAFKKDADISVLETALKLVPHN